MANDEYRIKPDTRYETIGWGILNHAGGMWGPSVFDTPEKAFEHIDTYQRENPRVNLSKHTVVQCLVTVEPIAVSMIGRRAVRPDAINATGADP